MNLLKTTNGESMHLLQKQKEKIGGKAIIYHGRIEKGLKVIAPHKCKHDKAYLYASENIALCIIFAVKRKGENIEFGISPFGKTYIKEFYEGAFEDRFRGREVCLYKFDKSKFECKTEYFEYVSEQPVEVIECKEISDAAEFLLDLEKEGKVKIYRYNKMTSRMKNEVLKELKKVLKQYVGFKELSEEEIAQLEDEKRLSYFVKKERRDFCCEKFKDLMAELENAEK